MLWAGSTGVTLCVPPAACAVLKGAWTEAASADVLYSHLPAKHPLTHYESESGAKSVSVHPLPVW